MNPEALQADKQLQLLLRTATNLGAQQVRMHSSRAPTWEHCRPRGWLCNELLPCSPCSQQTPPLRLVTMGPVSLESLMRFIGYIC